MTEDEIKAREHAAYQRGYAAGKKKGAKPSALLELTQTMLTQFMQGRWGTTDKDGKFNRWNLHDIEKKAVESAKRIFKDMEK